MHDDLGGIQAAYDTIAGDYDARWSVHVAEPQRRLTRELQLKRGERCADLGCGTGVDTLEMLRRVAPGPVVAVDCSPAMLEAARLRARTSGLALELRCQDNDAFVRECAPASFDVLSLRFCLGYLAWRELLPQLPGLLRPGGRIGILTILASSAPQAYTIYRQMSAELGVEPVELTALSSLDEITSLLQLGGGRVRSAWPHRFTLRFRTGLELASWLRSSGIATSPMLAALPAEIADALWAEFAARIEARRAREGLTLDFDLAGLVAESSAAPP